MFRLIALVLLVAIFSHASIPGYTSVYQGDASVPKVYVGDALVYTKTVAAIDGCLELDGADDYALTTYPPFSSSCTIAIWFRCRDIHNYVIIVGTAEGGPYTAQYVGFYESSPYLTGNMGEGDWWYGQFYSSTTMNNNEWVHVVITHNDYDADRIYINGVYQNMYSGVSTLSGATGVFALGCFFNNGSWPFNGYLDDFALWGRALSESEIANLYAHPNAAPATIGLGEGLVDYWDFNSALNPTGVNGGALSLMNHAKITDRATF